MTKQRLAILFLIPFSILTIYAVIKVGYVGIFDYQRHSPAGWQVFADLVIACCLSFVWIFPDAKRTERNPWPYAVTTVFFGSIGPLLYLALMPKFQSSSLKAN